MEANEQSVERVGGAQPPGPLADAPASNRASETYEDDRPVVYWQGIDFLEFSVRGDGNRQVLDELNRLKALAQSSDGHDQALAVLPLGQRIFQVSDKGAGRFRFVLTDPDYLVKVRSGDGSALPLAFVQVRSHYLVQVGATAAKDEAFAFLSSLGELHGFETVSRIDLAVDFPSSGAEERIQRGDWITHAGYRQSHSVKDRFTGWSIGQRGPTSFRLYDKYFEVVTESKKDWLFPLWTSRGWFHGDPVWRAEFQLRRSPLKEFGLSSLANVLDALPGLWTYLTGNWLRLAVPSEGDENRARWPTHPLWESLARVRWEGTRLELAKVQRPSNAPADRHIVRQIQAAITTEMAKEGIADPADAHQSLWEKLKAHCLDSEVWEGASMDRLLQSKALIKERRFGTFRLTRALRLLPTREPGEEG